ncbi:hypothetical protein AB0C98_09915 [Streptomyces sp. NPDC048558]|uniref:hypothetical protein n=1 Tax=Streptomyces sp. NPDC048558 TaxID=3155759 RepID=UPI0033DBDE57
MSVVAVAQSAGIKLRRASVLAVGDGALGFWKALAALLADVVDRVLCCSLSIASSASLPWPRRLHGAVLDCQGALSVEAGTVVLRSRRGTGMGPAFPAIVAAAGRLPDATAIDCVM